MAKTVKKVVKKAPVKKNTEQEKLAKELKTLIPKLDEEGLAFLIEQAQVHLYNMQVDELNKTIEKNAERKAAGKPAQGKSGNTAEKAAAGGSASGGFSEIKASESGGSYYIVYKTEWIMFSKEEIMALVKIAGGTGTDLEIKERLFNWLARERSDLLRSAGIAAKFDRKLSSLAGLLKKTFKIRKA